MGNSMHSCKAMIIGLIENVREYYSINIEKPVEKLTLSELEAIIKYMKEGPNDNLAKFYYYAGVSACKEVNEIHENGGNDDLNASIAGLVEFEEMIGVGD